MGFISFFRNLVDAGPQGRQSLSRSATVCAAKTLLLSLLFSGLLFSSLGALSAQAAGNTNALDLPQSPVPSALYQSLPDLAKPIGQIAAANVPKNLREIQFVANHTQLLIPTTRPLNLQDARQLSVQKLSNPSRMVLTLPDAVLGRRHDQYAVGQNGISTIKVSEERGALYGVSEISIEVEKASTLDKLSASVTDNGFVVSLGDLPKPFNAQAASASAVAEGNRIEGTTGQNIIRDVFFRDNKLQMTGVSNAQLEVSGRFTLDDPSRLVIDLHDTALADKSLATTLLAPHPDIRQIRIGQFSPDTVRLVIETPHPERWGAMPQEASNNELAVGYGGSTAAGRARGPWTSVTDEANKVVEIITRNIPRPRDPQNTTTDATRGSSQAMFPATVVIDAGHGGHDNGAMRNGYLEKNLNLEVAFKLRDALEKRGVKVYMTRESDVFLPLPKIVEIANRINPDLFVSVHTNASTNPSVAGLETYYYNANSRGLAQLVHNELVQDLDTPDRGVRRAMFYVIHHTRVPAILCEIGYLSNEGERAEMFAPTRQRKSANAIADGLVGYLNNTLSARAQQQGR
jgi:N-acetylmuramoyl-L-alanine amidase